MSNFVKTLFGLHAQIKNEIATLVNTIGENQDGFPNAKLVDFRSFELRTDIYEVRFIGNDFFVDQHNQQCDLSIILSHSLEDICKCLDDMASSEVNNQ